MPGEPKTPVALSLSRASESVVRAELSVAPNSICPIHDPARPPAIPASKGCRCMKDGCATEGCVDGAAAERAGAGCEGVVDAFGVIVRSIGRDPLSS